MTPRAATVLLRAPGTLSDQALADRLWRILRGEIPACQPGVVAPDPDSLEVYVTTISEADDAFMRRTVFGGEAP